MEDLVLYRPEWMCGRYNAKHQVAICYNLLAGMSYFFEDYSAQVLSFFINLSRNSSVSLTTIADETGIAMESLVVFSEQLKELGLITDHIATTEEISDYRHQLSIKKCTQRMIVERTIQEKLPFQMDDAEMAYTEKVGGVTSVMFELTYNCSEKCIHCYNIGATRNDSEKSLRGDREELILDDYKRIIDQLYDQGLFKVCLSGGDPFSKPIAWEIIEYLYSKNIAFDIFTNGQRIVDKVNCLAEYYPRLVGVSIYSGIAKDHDRITRVEGSWEKSMSVVKQLSALAVPINIKCCVMQSNLKSYYLVADIAKKYGAVPQFEVNLSDSVDGDKCVSKYLRLTPKQLEIVLRDSNVPLYVGKEAPNYGGQKKDMGRNPCGAGNNSFCITPDGNLIPCCAFHAVFGNLKHQALKDILVSPELSWWRNLKLSDYEECGTYDYCDYCNLCPGANFSEHGTPLKASENNCYMAKVRFELANKMITGNDPLNGQSLGKCLNRLPEYEPKGIQREQGEDFSDIKLGIK